MIELYDENFNCCGCSACMNICPESAISMCQDEEGFLYPQIDLNKCIECGLCNTVCVFVKGYDTPDNFDPPHVYAVKHSNDQTRINSTSGGAFTAISDYVLEQNGVIFGAAFDESFNVIHQKAETKASRNKFRGAKYVQSDLNSVFCNIKTILSENRQVLFSGTPCQTAGLKSFLGSMNIDKLILCDIVCHGTPSPLMWKNHLQYSEKKIQSKIVEYYCRSKVLGWHGHNEMIVFENGKKDYRSVMSQKHRNLFRENLILRPSCHHCPYTNYRRPSDITMGDFWHIERSMPDFDDNKGISLILVNTEKGQHLFEAIQLSLDFRSSNPKDCSQKQLHYPSKPSPQRSAFWRDYQEHGYEYIIKKYAGYSITSYLRQFFLKVLIRTKLLGLAKKVLRRDG